MLNLWVYSGKLDTIYKMLHFYESCTVMHEGKNGFCQVNYPDVPHTYGPNGSNSDTDVILSVFHCIYCFAAGIFSCGEKCFLGHALVCIT